MQEELKKLEPILKQQHEQTEDLRVSEESSSAVIRFNKLLGMDAQSLSSRVRSEGLW
jgi:hypothetical protein